MTPKPYTDEEIVVLLEDGRLAVSNINSAILLALKHSHAVCEIKWNPNDRGRDWYVSTSNGILDGLVRKFPCRITIPLPPKVRFKDGGDMDAEESYVHELPELLVITTEGGE